MSTEHPSSAVFGATARAVKASRLARVLDDLGASAADARALPAAGRRMAEQLAHVLPGSDATWQVVVDMLAWQARWGCAPGSVFVESPEIRAERREAMAGFATAFEVAS